MNLTYSGMPTALAEAYRRGALDANGQEPERHICKGKDLPCRHCLGNITDGEAYLILAYRPFPSLQPYAEVGPVFLHADHCPAYANLNAFPDREREGMGRIVRGYGADDRIVYGSAQVVSNDHIVTAAEAAFANPDVAYVHVRSALNNCFTMRIDRGSV
jgi:hypothetical protein